MYGQPHMTVEDYPRLAQTLSELGASSCLLLAVVRLGLSLVQLHQSVAGYVSTALNLSQVPRLFQTLPQVKVRLTTPPPAGTSSSSSLSFPLGFLYDQCAPFAVRHLETACNYAGK